MNTKFESRPRVEIFFKWIMFTAAITGMGLVAGFYPIHGNIPIIIIPCVLVLLFEKMKLTTLVVMRILVVFVALRMFDGDLYVNIILIMLVVNILEATFTDIFRYKKYLNGIAGIALAVGVLALRGGWLPDAATPIGDFYTVQSATLVATLCYIIAYTIWNWIFVSNEFSPSVALMHVGFLLAPILGSICTLELGIAGGFGMWLLLRANTLAIGGWLQIGAKSWFEKEFYSPNFEKFVNYTKKTSVQVFCMILNIALIAVAIGISLQTGYIGF